MTALIVVIWIVIGAVAAMALGAAIAPAFGFRDMEGMSAIFAVLFAAPVGAVAGALAGLRLARRYADRRAMVAVYSALVIVVAVAGGFIFEIATNDMMDRPARLVFDIRLPAGQPLPDWNDISGHIRSKGKDGSRISSYGRTGFGRDGNNELLQGYVEVYRQTTDRVLTLRIGQGPLHVFRLDLPAKPVETPAMGAWSRTAFIEDGASRRQPDASEALEIRYRTYY